MHQVIIGTAGHVDHGKTRLVKALTGIETDRLKEEQERGISIELGFAPLVLPGGQQVGLVDVPGHERFIKQMLAGVAGMDLVLLVIAADEGVMPQTQEHLDIIHLLQVKKGVVVLTKKDLVDNEWLEIMQMDIRDTLHGTVLEEAPIVTVSAVTGDGIEDLKKLIAQVAAQTIPKSATGKTRLPIDRVFSITGFGTVVTGTLWTGTVRLGDNVEILPQGLKTKIRSLQVHGEKVEYAQAGQRTAANITGIEVNEIERGSVLATPNFLKYTYRIDAKVMLLPNAYYKLQNLDRIRIYLGTKEVLGKVRLLDSEEIEKGSEAFAQIYLEKPLVAARGDRFVIRTYSPMHTIAGGIIIDPLAPKHKRFAPEVIKTLLKKEQGDPQELLLEYVNLKPESASHIKDVARQLNIDEQGVKEIMAELVITGEGMILGKAVEDGFTSKLIYEQWGKDTLATLEKFHKNNPLKLGVSKEELRSRVFEKLDTRIYNFLLETWQQEQKIVVKEDIVSLYGYEPQLTMEQRQMVDAIADKVKAGGLQPLSPFQIVQELGLPEHQQENIFNYLLETKTLIKGEDNLFFHREVMEEAILKLIAFAKENKGITLAEARDLLDSSRKYMLPILEYMDNKRITRRVGDKRVVIGN